jgi:diguanylate cyclase (GGDEF)-like protein/PAS domain S-box-containing protein
MVDRTTGKVKASRIDAMQRILEISEDWYRKVFHLSPDSMNINRLDDGLYVSINQGFTRITGFNEADVLGKTSIEIDIWVDPGDRNRLVQALKNEGQVINFEAKFRTKDGAYLDGLMSAAVMQLGGDAHVISITRNITDHKLVEAKQLQSEMRYRRLADDMPVFVVTFAPDGTMTFVNDAIAKLVCVPPSQLIGMVFFDFLNPVDCQLVKSRLSQLTPEHPVETHEQTYRMPGGKTVYHQWTNRAFFDGKGNVTHYQAVGEDITEREQADAKRKLAASVFDHAREGIVITDERGTIVDVNEGFSRITGYSREEVIGRNPNILSSGRQDQAFYSVMWKALTLQGHWGGEIWNRRKSGEVYAELLTISAVRNEQGNTQQYVALFSDITAAKDYQRQLEHIAHFDALTDLPNRLLLADRLQQAMVQAQRRGQKVAVAYLDLDGFKNVNDRHGHGVGDQLLVTLSKSMKESLREGDTLARLGGDEFVAVLIDLDGIESCTPMLKRLLDAAAAPLQLGDMELQCSASIGVTFYPQSQDVEPDQLLRQADQAMYQAKIAGKNHYHFFDAAQDSRMRSHHEQLEHVRLALLRGEFVLHYQPKVNMRSGQVIGAEALIRWQHPVRGLLAPAEFLSIIEDNPLAVDVGEWVIDAALTQVERWHEAGLDVPVSVNIGARQLQQSDFVLRLQLILAKYPGVNPASLELEVLETSALDDISQVSQLIEDCAQFGVRFVLDDFGTGYSSLTYLKRLRVVMLKIDQSFVRDMLDDSDSLAILEGVIGLAAAFKRKVIAEGVETVAHGTALMHLGCELAQGYGIARPMPAEQIPAWIATWRPDVTWGELPWLGGALESIFE